MEFFRMLTIWGRRSSFNVQKVMWLVGELRIEHRRIDAGGQFGGLDTHEFKRMNPHGRVPVIDDNGTVVWESHAILRYLAARYGPSQFWSEDASERSQVDRWMGWAQTALQPDFLMGVFWGFYRTPETQRNWLPFGRRLRGVPSIFSCWIGCSQIGGSCVAIRSVWPIFLLALRCFAISDWTSSVLPFHMYRRGTIACKNVRHTAST